MSGKWTYAFVVISPAMTQRPVVTRVSQATREAGSSASSASRTASEMASATLSGCPSVTDSEVKRLRSNTGFPTSSWRGSKKARHHAAGPNAVDDGAIVKKAGQSAPGNPSYRYGASPIASDSRRAQSGMRLGDAPDDALDEGHRARRDAQLPHAEPEQRERHERLRGHLAAHGHVDVAQRRHLHRALDQPQHGRVQRRESRR